MFDPYVTFQARFRPGLMEEVARSPMGKVERDRLRRETMAALGLAF